MKLLLTRSIAHTEYFLAVNAYATIATHSTLSGWDTGDERLAYLHGDGAALKCDRSMNDIQTLSMTRENDQRSTY